MFLSLKYSKALCSSVICLINVVIIQIILLDMTQIGEISARMNKKQRNYTKTTVDPVVVSGWVKVAEEKMRKYIEDHPDEFTSDEEYDKPKTTPKYIFDKMEKRPVLVPPILRHNRTIIFLHGLGETGNDWIPALDNIRKGNMKIVCPNANYINVTIRNGSMTTAWFDIRGHILPQADEDYDGIQKAVNYTHYLIEEEMKTGLPSNRIILGGHGQGGAVALYAALTFKKKLGGIMALSTWLPLLSKFDDAIHYENRDIPLLQCHGDNDPTTSFFLGGMTEDILRRKATKNINYVVVVNGSDYHTIREVQIGEMKKFILSHEPPVRVWPTSTIHDGTVDFTLTMPTIW